MICNIMEPAGVVLHCSDRIGAWGEDCLRVQWVNNWTWLLSCRAAKGCNFGCRRGNGQRKVNIILRSWAACWKWEWIHISHRRYLKADWCSTRRAWKARSVAGFVVSWSINGGTWWLVGSTFWGRAYWRLKRKQKQAWHRTDGWELQSVNWK